MRQLFAAKNHIHLVRKEKTIFSAHNATTLRMESRCKFISSRGLMGLCDVHSTNPQSSCATDVGYLLRHVTIHKQRPGESIYICSDALRWFVGHCLQLVTESFILVTGDSDLTVPNEALSMKEFGLLIGHPKLIVWYAQNLASTGSGQYPKLRPLPIGLDYHTLHQPSLTATIPHKWSANAMSPQSQEDLLIQIRNRAPSPTARPNLIYCNMHFTLDRWGDRSAALEQMPATLFAKESAPVDRAAAWRHMAQCRFVVSPYGNGYDCHRTWEALLLGCIPIVCQTKFPDLFAGLPVLQVSKWSDVTAELLVTTANIFESIPASTVAATAPKLTLEYWDKRIHSIPRPVAVSSSQPLRDSPPKMPAILP